MKKFHIKQKQRNKKKNLFFKNIFATLHSFTWIPKYKTDNICLKLLNLKKRTKHPVSIFKKGRDIRPIENHLKSIQYNLKSTQTYK